MTGKTKKISKTFITTCFVVIVGLFHLFMAPASKAATVTLRFADYNPPRGLEATGSMWLMDQIEKRTNGEVKFQQYYGETLLKARELLKGIQSGTADMGFIQIFYYPKELAAWSVSIPFILGPHIPLKRAEFFWDIYNQLPELQTQLTNLNQKLVALHTFGKHAVGGPKPIKSLADLKGLRVRTGGFEAEHMRDLGANTVFLPGTEVYSAMQKGAIDVNYAPLTSYYKYKLYEIGDRNHLLVIPQHVGAVCLITVNLDTWNRLPGNVKQVMINVGQDYSKKQSEMILEFEQEYREKMIKAGCTIIDIPKEEVRRWADLTEKRCKEKWVKQANEQGLPGEKLMHAASQIIRKYSD